MLKRRGNMYYLDILIDGKRKRVSTGSTDKHAAQLMLPDMIAQLIQGESEASEDTLTLTEGFQRLMFEEWRHTKDAAGVAHHVAEIERLMGKDTPLKNIDRTAMLRLQQALASMPGKGGKTCAPATVNRKMATIVRLLSVAHNEWQVIGSPPKVKQLQEPESLIRALTDDEVKVLMDTAQLKHRLPFQFLIETGCRMGEFLAINWEHLDLDNQLLNLNPDRQMSLKSNRGRSIPLSKGVTKALLRRRDRGDLSPFQGVSRWTIRGDWDKCKAAMGLQNDSGFVPHALRHTCATRLINSGVPTSTVQKWLGHADITTTTRYLDQTVEDMAGYADLISVTPQPKLRAVQ